MSEIRRHLVTIGVAGGTASGKTTISQAILDQVGRENIAYLIHDSYYKELEELAPDGDVESVNFDHPASLDTPLLIEHIKQLKDWRPIEQPIYDFVRFQREKTVHIVEPRPVILVEGILVLAEPELREMFDIKIFVDTPADTRFIRRLVRDIEERGRTVMSVIQQYINTVQPMHLAFVEPSKRYADVIIPQGGYNPVAVSMIVDSVRGIMNG